MRGMGVPSFFHMGAGLHLQCDQAGLGIAQEGVAGMTFSDAQDALERDRRLAARHLDGEEVGRRAADRIGAQDRVVDDRRGIDEHGLHADV